MPSQLTDSFVNCFVNKNVVVFNMSINTVVYKTVHVMFTRPVSSDSIDMLLCQVHSVEACNYART